MITSPSFAPSGALESALPEPYRAAIYYAPARHDPLWQAGCAWLGRDPETDTAIAQPGVLAHLTASPRRYGLHATLKPPFHPKHGFAALLADTKSLAATLQPFAMPPLRVARLGRFLALCLAAPSPAFQNLADTCVTALDGHRRPEDAAAQAARAAGRTARQQRNVERFGYPLIFEDWRFHMTLSDPMDDDSLLDQAETYFEGVLEHPRRCDAICMFEQRARDSEFVLSHRISFGS